MPESEDKPWSPEGELDPAKLQAEGIKQLKRVADLAEEDKREREERLKKDLALPDGPALVGMPVYVRPTFSQVSVELKRAWEETQRIAPEAPPTVQVYILQALHHTPSDEESSQEVEASDGT